MKQVIVALVALGLCGVVQAQAKHDATSEKQKMCYEQGHKVASSMHDVIQVSTHYIPSRNICLGKVLRNTLDESHKIIGRWGYLFDAFKRTDFGTCYQRLDQSETVSICTVHKYPTGKFTSLNSWSDWTTETDVWMHAQE